MKRPFEAIGNDLRPQIFPNGWLRQLCFGGVLFEHTPYLPKGLALAEDANGLDL